MIKTIAIAIVVLVAGILVLAMSKPDSFRVERSTVIKAPAASIHPLINDFHRWESWSPWEKLDPAMKRMFAGAPSGKGAVYEWAGDSKVGAGRMEILDSSVPSKVGIKLDFIKPIEGHNITDFSLQDQGGATRVTWSMYGAAPFISKLMQVFVNMDTMIGKDFETGLANMKAIAEKTT